MADLGLAIAGVAVAGAELVKRLFALYRSARDSYGDAKVLAINLGFLKAVLLELETVVQKGVRVISVNAEDLIKDLLKACRELFGRIDAVIIPYLPRQQHINHGRKVARRVAWHFRKDNVRLLIAQLESLKSTTQLIMSVFSLASQMSQSHSTVGVNNTIPLGLKRHLIYASQLVEGQRLCITNLSVIEERLCISRDDTATEGSTGQAAPRDMSQETDQTARISAWLSDVVGLSESGSNPSTLPSTHSGNSAITLSAAERSVAGAASNDVEMLLDRWTNLAELRSRYTPSVAEGSVGTKRGEEKQATSLHDATVPPPARALSLSTNSDRTSSTTDSTPRQASRHHQNANLDESEESKSPAEGRSPSQRGDADLSGRLDIAEASSLKDPHQDIPRPTEGLLRPPDQIQQLSDDKERTSLLFDTTAVEEDSHTIRGPPNENDSPGAEQISPRINQEPRKSSRSYVQDWLFGQETSVDITIDHLPGLFSDVSILDLAYSRAGSVISTTTISTMGTVSDPRRVQKLIKLGNKLFRLKKYQEACNLYREAYEGKQEQEVDDKESLELEFRLGIVLGELRKFDAAERLLRSALSKAKEDGDDLKLTSLAEHFLARALCRQSKWSQAATLYQSLWESKQQALNGAPTRVSTAETALRIGQEYGSVLVELGRFEPAVSVLDLVVMKARELRGGDDFKVTLRSALLLGTTYNHLERHEKSETLLREVLCKLQSSDQGTSALAADCMNELAMIAKYHERFDEAEKMFETADKLRRSHFGPDHPKTMQSSFCLALILQKMENVEDARRILEQIRQPMESHFGRNHERTLELHLRLAEILDRMNEDEEAQSILLDAYDTHKTGSRESLQISQALGPLMLKDLRKSNARSTLDRRLIRAADVYKNLYTMQKMELGLESPRTLQNGHDYGCIHSDMGQFATAENILQEVWLGRKKVLGESDPSSIQTGFQLGRVLFLVDKRDDALNTLGSIHDLRMAMFGPQSMQTIESAECLGYIMISGTPDMNQTRKAYQLFESTFEARKEMFGPVPETLTAALQFASLSATRGDLMKSQTLCKWVFDSGRRRLHPPAHESEQENRALSIISGISASGLAFVQDNRTDGNRYMQHVVNYAQRAWGQGSKAQSVAYLQASLLFLQRESDQSMTILRSIFDQRRFILGRRHADTRRSAYLLGFGVIADSVLARKPVLAEADKLNDWLFAQKGKSTFLMNASFVLGAYFTTIRLDYLAKPLFLWVYKSMKRNYGRLSKESLLSLAFIHALKVWRLYRKVKRIPSNERTKKDPATILPKLWDDLVRSLASSISKSTGPGGTDGLISRILPKAFARIALWKAFERETVMKMRANESFGGDFNNILRNAFAYGATAETPGDASDTESRVWTVGSDVSDLEGPGKVDEETDVYVHAPINFSEIFGAQEIDPMSSFAGSLFSLAESGEGDTREMEDHMENLRDRLTDMVSQVDLESMKSNINNLEEEIDSD